MKLNSYKPPDHSYQCKPKEITKIPCQSTTTIPTPSVKTNPTEEHSYTLHDKSAEFVRKGDSKLLKQGQE
jgi:hypothetical protein